MSLDRRLKIGEKVSPADLVDYNSALNSYEVTHGTGQLRYPCSKHTGVQKRRPRSA